MRESKIEKECKEWAEVNGWLTMKYTGERSYPDRIFIKGGVHIWMEFKAPGKRPTQAQKYRIDQLRNSGAIVDWSDNFEDFQAILLNNDPTY